MGYEHIRLREQVDPLNYEVHQLNFVRSSERLMGNLMAAFFQLVVFGNGILCSLIYSFIEALSAMLQKVDRNRKITNVPVARGMVRLNHLFFY
jgi:hypothetical protein